MRLRSPSPPPDLAPAQAPTSREPLDLGAARRQTSTRSRLRRAGIVAGVVAVVGLVTWLVGYSGLMTADDIQVRGAEADLAQAVTSAAQVPLGTPLARLDTGEVTDRVQAVPAVASAMVSRSWPSTVVVTVVPRVPLASLAGDDGWAAVDAEGVVFGASATPLPELPVLVGPATAEAADARAAGVAAAASLPAGLLAEVERIEAPSPVQVRLVLRDGRVVIWGSGTDGERKAQVLEALLETPATQYDVSVADRPTLRPS